MKAIHCLIILCVDGDSDHNLRPDGSVSGDGEGGSWTGWAWNVGTSVGSLLLPGNKINHEFTALQTCYSSKLFGHFSRSLTWFYMEIE